jgi:DNA-binding transcriptional LysR family regulator
MYDNLYDRMLYDRILSFPRNAGDLESHGAKMNADIDVRVFEQWCRQVLPDLATFYAACSYKNRSKAGDKLGKRGQNVGKSITRLERLLKDFLGGGWLIDHNEPRSVISTEAGEELFRYCQELASSRARVLDNLTRLQRGSEVRLAMTHYAWLAYGSALEAAYKQQRPDGIVNFGDKFYGQDRVWEDIEQEIVKGKADIGVYSFPPSRQKDLPKNLSARDWIEEEIVLVVPKGFVKSAKSTISLANLPAFPRVVHYSRSLNFDRTDTIERYLKHQNVRDRFAGDWLLGVNTISEIKDTLLHKGGMSFLPWPTVEREYRKGMLEVFRLSPPMRPRVMKIICRLHTSRGAIRDFLRAAYTLDGPRVFKK